jgi:flagellin-like protein
MNNKKGISAIVATVLIILITVAAVTIIWAAIIPMINNQLESGTVCLDAVSAVQLKDEGYTCYNTTAIPSGTIYEGNYSVNFHVGRTSKDFDLNGIQVLVSVGGDTTTQTIALADGVLGPNGADVFEINSSDFNVATKIQIAPIVGVGATEETCDISATKVLTEC